MRTDLRLQGGLQVRFSAPNLQKSLAQNPYPDGDPQPSRRRRRQHPRYSVRRQQTPHYDSKGNQPDAAHRRAGSVHGGHLPSSAGAVQPGTFLLFAFMLFNQRGAGGKNRGKGQKKTSHAGTKFFRDEARQYGDESAEKEADRVLVPAAFFQTGRLQLDFHRSQLTRNHTNHSPSALTSHRMVSEAVVFNAETL